MVLGDLQPNFRSLGRRSGSSSWMWVSTSGSVVFSTGKTFKVDFAAGRETYRCRAVKRCAVWGSKGAVMFSSIEQAYGQVADCQRGLAREFRSRLWCVLLLVVNSPLHAGAASFIRAAVASSCAKLPAWSQSVCRTPDTGKLGDIPSVANKSRICTWDIPHAKEKGNFCYRL